MRPRHRPEHRPRGEVERQPRGQPDDRKDVEPPLRRFSQSAHAPPSYEGGTLTQPSGAGQAERYHVGTSVAMNTAARPNFFFSAARASEPRSLAVRTSAARSDGTAASSK